MYFFNAAQKDFPSLRPVETSIGRYHLNCSFSASEIKSLSASSGVGGTPTYPIVRCYSVPELNDDKYGIQKRQLWI